MSTEAYAGDLSVREAWEMLSSDSAAVLVDCRTRPEWAFVGVPDLSSLGSQAVLVEWQEFPSMQVNAEFAAQLSAGASLETKGNQPLLFLCRTGGRSRAAATAMTEAGLGPCYNVSGGFEGPLDNNKHRGGSDGWKAAALPWTQE